MTVQTEILVEDLRFPEGCRWHDGSLWFSDMHSGVVYRADREGRNPVAVMSIDDRVSGMDWLPDGSLVVSGMLTRQVFRRSPDGVMSVYADLLDATPYPINDLIRLPSGHIIVGGFGYDLYADDEPLPGPLLSIDERGAWSLVADDLVFPNGMVLLSTGELIVAETFAGRLTAYDLDGSGGLTGKRLWAQLPEGATPDGLCVDGDDAVWVSSIVPQEFLRVTAGGTVTDTLALGDRLAVDCVLGGPDGRTLFLATADSWAPEETERTRAGRIESVAAHTAGVSA